MFQILAYINYWLRQVDEHSLHSPFLFRFYNELIKAPIEEDEQIEELRSALKKDQTKIILKDLGAGSRISNKNERSIASIAKHSASPLKFSVFLQKLIVFSGAETVWELGTSLGLNTLYMAKNKGTQVLTFEGDPSLAQMAQKHFVQFGAENIQLLEGNIDQSLPSALQATEQIDLVYLDANHGFSPTLDYFHQLVPKMSPKGIMVFDDIHWSREMSRAWKEIKSQQRQSLSIDLFEAGIIFLDQDLPKEDYIVKF